MNIIIDSKPKPSAIISDDIKQVVIEKINSYIDEYSSENIDFYTVSSHLLFSGNFAYSLDDLINSKFYYNGYKYYRLHKINNEYLYGCEIVNNDFRLIYEQFKHEKELVLIVDPPYLYTDISGYKGVSWQLKDFLELIEIVKKHPFIMFSSEKSECKTFIDWYLQNGKELGYLKSYIYIYKEYSLCKTKSCNIRNNDFLFYSTSL